MTAGQLGAGRAPALAQRPAAPDARALLDRDEAAELEPRQLDPARATHREEAESARKSRGEDGAVDEEPLLVSRLALRVAVGEGLERLRAAVRASPIAARKSDCITQGVAASTR